MKKQKITTVQENGKKITIGEFDTESKTLYVKRKKSVHFYNKLQAWGFDANILNSLIMEQGLQHIIILELESLSRYKAELNDLLHNMTYLNHRPYGLQRFLKETYWTKL